MGGKEASQLSRRLEALDARIAAHPLAPHPAVAARLGALQAKRALAAAARAARREAKAAAGLVLGDELASRQRLLRRLGYLDDEGLVTTKGRVAADLQVGSSFVLGLLEPWGTLLASQACSAPLILTLAYPTPRLGPSPPPPAVW